MLQVKAQRLRGERLLRRLLGFLMILLKSYIYIYSTVNHCDIYASTCHTDTTPTSHTETPTHIETRTHNQCGDTIEKSQAPDDGCIKLLAPDLFYFSTPFI